MLHTAGLDIFLGTPPPPLHIFYCGLLQKLLACTFCCIQRQVSKARFTALGKRIDTWLRQLSSNCPWLKTSFSKGLSHFLYGAYVDANDPWASTVKFGKIASKHVYRDICRFWRLLLIDLMPECPPMMQLFTDFFEYMELILRRAHTETSLRVAEERREAWQSAALHLFGKEEFEAMIKFHLVLHYSRFIKGRGGLPWWHDEDGEASLRPNAKQLLRRTNMGFHLEAQLATVVERRDAVRLILHVLKSQTLAQDGCGGNRMAAPAQVVGPSVALMGQRPIVAIVRREVQAAHAELAQLEFAIRLYLHLAQSPANDENVHLRDMPSLASEVLHVRKGLYVRRWPTSPSGAWRGGAKIYAKFTPQRSSGKWQLPRSRMQPVFVAVKRGGTTWYGELILCFSASYRPRSAGANDLSLCFVRWLQPIDVVARVERRPLTAAEQAGPFEVYRWAKHTGSYHRGHPRHSTPQYGIIDSSQVKYRAPLQLGPAESQHDPNPLFRLVTDMMDRF